MGWLHAWLRRRRTSIPPCVTCQWFVRGTEAFGVQTAGLCAHPLVRHPVDGAGRVAAAMVRLTALQCGPRGRWWEKNPTLAGQGD